MLIDAHVHLALDGINFQAARRQHATPDRFLIREVLLSYKKMGIMALRDGGDNLNVSLTAREIASEEGMIVRTPAYAFL
jgi:predicted TIM-barrel fold metal-dependent hydrolase